MIALDKLITIISTNPEILFHKANIYELLGDN